MLKTVNNHSALHIQKFDNLEEVIFVDQSNNEHENKTFTGFRKKCGEIFLDEDCVISFSCTFCQKICKQLSDLLRHLWQNHLPGSEDKAQVNAQQPPVVPSKCEILDATDETISIAYDDDNEENLGQLIKLEVESLPEFYEGENIAQFEQLLIETNTIAKSEPEDFSEGDQNGETLHGLEYLEIDEYQSKENTKIVITEEINPKHTKANKKKDAGEQGPCVCELCGKVFRRRRRLLVHLKIHAYGKTHACEYCDQKFAESSTLRTHRFRHLGIKPHRCSICDKAFTSTTEVKLHMRSHTGERPYMCPECGQTFTNSAHLHVHLRRHRNERLYVCLICDKRFNDAKRLRDHEAGHSSVRPHKCTECDSAFNRRKTLLAHMKLHSEVKQYVCKYCSKEFAQSPGLRSHVKKYHPEEK